MCPTPTIHSRSINMSVWESIETLRDFTYSPQHLKVFRDRARWFEKPDQPHYCLWWIPAGHIPTVAEARGRLESYQQHGATPYAFWFSQHLPCSRRRIRTGITDNHLSKSHLSAPSAAISVFSASFT